MEDNRKMTSELRSNRNEGKIKSNRRRTSKWSVWLKFPIRIGLQCLICFDDVKVGWLFCSPKPNCSGFQYHQLNPQTREALFINDFMKKQS